MIEIKNLKGEVIYTYNGATLRWADLHGLDLHEADLHGLDLHAANLSECNISNANLTWARLTSADLSHSDLSGADLTGADIRHTNLSWANLSYADLRVANFTWANLLGANLHLANLSWANLLGANLYKANLLGANLYNADICEANLDGIRYNEATSFFALQCPEKDSFTAYKKVYDYIIELEIPEDAKRSSATTRKCRCSKAKVLGIYDSEHNLLDIQEVINHNYKDTVYKVGEFVYPDSWDEDRWHECSNGIHFFMTFQEAVNYEN